MKFCTRGSVEIFVPGGVLKYLYQGSCSGRLEHLYDRFAEMLEYICEERHIHRFGLQYLEPESIIRWLVVFIIFTTLVIWCKLNFGIRFNNFF